MRDSLEMEHKGVDIVNDDNLQIKTKRGRPPKYNTEEERIQAKREIARSFYYTYQDYISLQKKIYYEKNKEIMIDKQRERRARKRNHESPLTIN